MVLICQQLFSNTSISTLDTTVADLQALGTEGNPAVLSKSKRDPSLLWLTCNILQERCRAPGVIKALAGIRRHFLHTTEFTTEAWLICKYPGAVLCAFTQHGEDGMESSSSDGMP